MAAPKRSSTAGRGPRQAAAQAGEGLGAGQHLGDVGDRITQARDQVQQATLVLAQRGEALGGIGDARFQRGQRRGAGGARFLQRRGLRGPFGAVVGQRARRGLRGLAHRGERVEVGAQHADAGDAVLLQVAVVGQRALDAADVLGREQDAQALMAACRIGRAQQGGDLRALGGEARLDRRGLGVQPRDLAALRGDALVERRDLGRDARDGEFVVA